MKRLQHIIMAAAVAFAAAYMLLQIGRMWGRADGFSQGRQYGVESAKMELAHALSTESGEFWFGRVRVLPASGRVEVRR